MPENGGIIFLATNALLSSQVKLHKKKFLKIILIPLAAVLVILLAVAFWLYSGNVTTAKNDIFQTLPLPMALVNGQNISMQAFTFRYQLAQKLNSSSTPENDQQLRQEVYNQLVYDSEVFQIADSHDVFVTQKQIDAEYNLTATQANLQGQNSFEALLASYGLNQTQYKDQVIEPKLLLENLKVWFYSQQNLNSAEYTQANSLVQNIQSGQDMGALAAQYTQDLSGQSVKGDLGFVQLTDILPELREPVDSMAVGSVKIIPSQYGLHILKLEAKTGSLYHLRQIFLNGENFNAWLTLQTQNFKIKKLLQI
jgi:hypothetical protein